MNGDLSALPASETSTGLRVSPTAVAASIAGAVFVGLTIEALAAGTIWSLAMLAGLPWAAMLAGEALALAGCVVLTVLLARHAIGLDAMRAKGLPV